MKHYQFPNYTESLLWQNYLSTSLNSRPVSKYTYLNQEVNTYICRKEILRTESKKDAMVTACSWHLYLLFKQNLHMIKLHDGQLIFPVTSITSILKPLAWYCQMTVECSQPRGFRPSWIWWCFAVWFQTLWRRVMAVSSRAKRPKKHSPWIA